jgi:hypothetical protein
MQIESLGNNILGIWNVAHPCTLAIVKHEENVISILFFRSYTRIYGALQIHYEISPSVSRERERNLSS